MGTFIGLIFITKLINNLSGSFSTSDSFFQFEGNIGNWLSTFLIVIICAYNLFQKSEWFIKPES